MRKPLFKTITNVKPLNFRLNLKVFRLFFTLVVIGFVNLFFAQEKEVSRAEYFPGIILKDGAKIYSEDIDFNHLVLSQEFNQEKNKVNIVKNIDSKRVLILASENTLPQKKDLGKQIKIAELKRQKADLEKIKKEINLHNLRKRKFFQENVQSFPSGESFFASRLSTKNYISSSISQFNFSKIGEYKDISPLCLSLDYLHSQLYSAYNTQSLDFCFSEFFSVRPPPVVS